MIETYEVQIQRNANTGVIEYERWELNGNLHRVGAPALIHRDPQSGRILIEEWFKHGRNHRPDGPAIAHYPLNGEAGIRLFFIEGEEVEPRPPFQEQPAP